MEHMTTAFLPIIGKTAYNAPALALKLPPTRPFFTVYEDAAGIVSRFMTAVTSSDENAARRFLSKRFLAGELTDPAQLKRFMEESSAPAQGVRYVPSTQTQNTALTKTELWLGKRGMLRLHLIHEPDGVSAWKIYAIEREKI